MVSGRRRPDAAARPGYDPGMSDGHEKRVCPTCAETGAESAGEDVVRCLNCGFLWVVSDAGEDAPG